MFKLLKDSPLSLFATIMAIIIVFALAPVAIAGNSVLFSSKTGDIAFPISPPSKDGNTPGNLDNTVIGAATPRDGTFVNLSATKVTAGQIVSGSGTPTIASGACGTGTNGTITGTNQSGKITIGASATTACAVSFSATLAAAPNSCQLTPASTGAAAWGTTGAYISAITTGGFTVTGSALASTVYYFQCL
ncbi:MAG: hypothetical protein JSS57_07325 [Proteobacteria bacterium]|nr:hypothetical protein [Pseudomonadota bacterium]